MNATYPEILNIIKRTEREQRLYSLLMLKKYEDYLLYYKLKKGDKPILYIGLEQYDHKILEMMYFFNSIPNEIEIFVSTSNAIKALEDQRHIKCDTHKRRKEIKFKTLDLYEISKTEEKEKKEDEIEQDGTYSHIISLWSLRWTYNMSESLKKIRKLLASDGTAFLLIESKSQLYVALDKISEIGEWAQILEPIIKGMPPFWKLGFGKIEEAIGAELVKNEWAYLATHDYCVVTYTSFQKYKESLEKRYNFSSIIPPLQLEKFYELLYTAFRDISVVNPSGKKVAVTVAYTTFVITSKETNLKLPVGMLENAAERWCQNKKKLQYVEVISQCNSPVESRKSSLQTLFCGLSIGTSVSVVKVPKYEGECEYRSTSPYEEEEEEVEELISPKRTPEKRAATPHNMHLLTPAKKSSLLVVSPSRDQSKSPKRTPERRPATPQNKNRITPAKKSANGATSSKNK